MLSELEILGALEPVAEESGMGKQSEIMRIKRQWQESQSECQAGRMRRSVESLGLGHGDASKTPPPPG